MESAEALSPNSSLMALRHEDKTRGGGFIAGINESEWLSGAPSGRWERQELRELCSDDRECAKLECAGQRQSVQNYNV